MPMSKHPALQRRMH